MHRGRRQFSPSLVETWTVLPLLPCTCSRPARQRASGRLSRLHLPSLFRLGLHMCAATPSSSGSFWGLNLGCRFCKDKCLYSPGQLPALFRLLLLLCYLLVWCDLLCLLLLFLVFLWDSCPKPHCSEQCLGASFTRRSSGNFTDSDLQAFNTISGY